MGKIYSTYEAKAKFSEILRMVREGSTVTVSYRGEPVAEIRPLGGAQANFARHLRRLEDRGVLVRPPERTGSLTKVRRRPGALRRFLAEREE